MDNYIMLKPLKNRHNSELRIMSDCMMRVKQMRILVEQQIPK